MELTVEGKKRPEGAKTNALRRSGQIPAVLYGHDGANSVELTVDAKSAELMMKKVVVNNTIVNLNIQDLGWSGKTLLREVQSHPWKGKLYHLSFFSVASQSSVDVVLPLHFVGEAPGVKTGGGTLDTVLTELAVHCPPTGIPDYIEVDISNMQAGDALHVSDLKLPAGVVASGESDRVVVSVLGSRSSDAAPAEEA